MIKAATLARFNYAIKRHFFHVKMSREKKGILKVRPQLDCAGSVTPRRESRQVRLYCILVYQRYRHPRSKVSAIFFL